MYWKYSCMLCGHYEMNEENVFRAFGVIPSKLTEILHIWLPFVNIQDPLECLEFLHFSKNPFIALLAKWWKFLKFFTGIEKFWNFIWNPKKAQSSGWRDNSRVSISEYQMRLLFFRIPFASFSFLIGITRNTQIEELNVVEVPLE